MCDLKERTASDICLKGSLDAGMEEVLAAWGSWTPEVRARTLAITDAELVMQIEAHMKSLWEAEIKARQAGVSGPVHPFDHSQLPLLSTMQFGETGRSRTWAIRFDNHHMTTTHMNHHHHPIVKPDTQKTTTPHNYTATAPSHHHTSCSITAPCVWGSGGVSCNWRCAV